MDMAQPKHAIPHDLLICLRNALPGLIIALVLLCWLGSAQGAGAAVLDPPEVSSYETTMISSGDNRPDFSVGDPKLKGLLVSLHLGIRPEEFQAQWGWTREQYQHALQLLLAKGFVREGQRKFLPSCMVITDKEGQRLFRFAEPLSRQIASLIITSLGTIQGYYSRTELSKTASFEQLSFLILSDVLLDNWQISNVEAEFLGHERPLRHGKRYYFALMQNLQPPREAFGIYGNGGYEQFMVYGNNRKAGLPSVAPTNSDGVVSVCEADHTIFGNLAEFFRPQLLNLLRTNKAYIQKVYRKSGYASQVSFEEFFIWWYHFVYTRTTDILARAGCLQVPKSGNCFYRLTSDTAQGSTVTMPSLERAPSVDSIVERYIEAIGGQAALEKLATETREGEFCAGGKAVPLVIHAAAGGKWYCRLQVNPNPVLMQCSQVDSWLPANRPADIPPAVFAERAATFELQFPLHLRSYCPDLRVVGRDQSAGRCAWVLQSRLPDSHILELAFDEQSGLLLRLGSTEFRDYTEHAGIKRPATLRWPQDGNSAVLNPSRYNQPLPDDLFK